MASSFSQKSSSSASKQPKPKPTYRRASAAKKAAAPRAGRAPKAASTPRVSPASASTKRAIGSYNASAAKRPHVAVPKTAAPKKRTAPLKAPRAAATTVKAAPRPSSAPKSRKRGLKLPFSSKKAAATGRPLAATPRAAAPAKATPVAGALAAAGGLLGRLPRPRRSVLAIALGALAALVLVAFVVANSGLFAATDVRVKGSEHVEQKTAEQLVALPEGTTLLNVSEAQVLEGLSANPWVSGVKLEREFPHTLVITPQERSVKAVVYITADDIAWAIGEDGAWIAPLSLSFVADAEGNEVARAEDGSVPEGATELTGLDAARAIARRDGALLLIDAPSDISPKSGAPVTSDVVLAGLEYAKGFSSDFMAQIKDLSIASVESIAANLTSGVEVLLGSPENITEKERVVTKLLSQESGVTYVNVREPGAYTFRAAPVP